MKHLRTYHPKMIQILSAAVVIVVIVFLMLNMLISKMIGSIVLDKNLEYVDNISEKIKQEINYMQEKASSVFNYLQYSELPQAFFQEDGEPEYFELLQRVSSFLISVTMIYPELNDIVLAGKKVYASAMRSQDIEALLARFPNPEGVVCAGILQQEGPANQKYQVVCFLSDIYGSQIGRDEYAQPIGVCILPIRLDRLNWGETEKDGNTSFLILDGDRNFFPINCTEAKAAEIISHLGASPMEPRIDDPRFLITVRKSEEAGLYLVSYTDKSQLLKDVTYVQMLVLFLGGASVLLLLLIVFVVYRNVIAPISVLRGHMRDIANGNFIQLKVHAAVKGSREVWELANSLNAMTDELDDRTHRLFRTSRRLYEMEVEKQKAEIAFLRSQINPHFLYNSLETIKGLGLRGGLPEVAAVANNLGKIFRYSIKGNGVVPFRAEVDIARAFVEIQRSRFPHKVTVAYHFAENTLDIPVACMILQPIIENVFLHSVEKNTEPTFLYLASALSGDELVVTVQDDGVGIAPEKLEELRDALETGSVYDNCHVGIANVNLRLRRMYGGQYGVRIDGRLGEGFKVTLHMKRFVEPENQMGDDGNGIDGNPCG